MATGDIFHICPRDTNGIFQIVKHFKWGQTPFQKRCLSPLIQMISTHQLPALKQRAQKTTVPENIDLDALLALMGFCPVSALNRKARAATGPPF
jgi:hypothetical protein